MSFVVTVYVPEAIVMASDSRQFITVRRHGANGEEQRPVETINSDFVYKTFLLERRGIGISVFGESVLGGASFESHLRRFEEKNTPVNQDVEAISEKLMKYFQDRFRDVNISFHVAGFRKESGISVPHVYNCQVLKTEISRLNVAQNSSKVVNGCSWGGQVDIIAALMSPVQIASRDGTTVTPVKMPIIWDAMSVQDAIDFAIYAVRTTIDTIRFQARPKSVGGPIDVLLLTPEKAHWIQRKQFRGST